MVHTDTARKIGVVIIKSTILVINIIREVGERVGRGRTRENRVSIRAGREAPG